MCAVAERLVVALPATTKLDDCSAGYIIFVSLLVKNFYIAFDVKTSVIFYRNFCGHNSPSLFDEQHFFCYDNSLEDDLIIVNSRWKIAGIKLD